VARTPNPQDPGVCEPACTSSTQCNAAGASTAFTCTGGACHCSSNSDCGQSTCDFASGTCYAPCNTTSDCYGYGCCAQSGSLTYCDVTQPSGSSSGSSGTFSTGPHASWPQVPTAGGPVLANPRVVTITYDGYDQRDAIDAWSAWIVQSSWLTAVGNDYAVGAGTNQVVHLGGSAPQNVDDNSLPDGGLSPLAAWLDGLLGAQLPAPDGNTLYMVYYPASTVISNFGWSSCQQFGGYHESFVSNAVAGNPVVAYALLPECPAFGQSSGLTTLQYTEVAASHELIEAASDPQQHDKAWYLSDPSNAWTFTFGEIGDLCVGTSTYYDATGLFAAQRIWSNTAAQGAGSPCIPLPATSPIFAGASPTGSVPNQIIGVAPGQALTLTIEGWSTGPLGAWPVTVYQTGGGDNQGGTGPTVTISPQWGAVANDGTTQFTVTMPSGTASGQGAYAVLSVYSYVGGSADTLPWPVLVYAP
jgi:hypothetical protein